MKIACDNTMVNVIIKSLIMTCEALVYAAYISPAKSRAAANDRIFVNTKTGARKRYDLEGMRVLRDLFLDAPNDAVADILPFLNASGVWDARWSEIKLKEVKEDEKAIRFLLTGKRPPGFATPKPWVLVRIQQALLASGLTVQAIRMDNPEAPPGLLELAIFDVRGALYLSTWQDLLEKSDYRYCARKDCRTHGPTTAPFRANRQDQIYCTWDCAHVVAMRNQRAKQRIRKKRGK